MTGASRRTGKAWSRRELLAGIGGAALLPTLTSCTREPPSPTAPQGEQLHYLSLRQIARRIEAGEVSLSP